MNSRLALFKAELKDLTSTSDERIGVLWRDLETGETFWALNEMRPAVSASIIKVPIMLAVFRQIQMGSIALKDKHIIEDILPDSEVIRKQQDYTLEELITWMIVVSDNTATNYLIDLVGMSFINAYFNELGLKNTVLMRRMLDFNAVAQGQNNFTTLADDYRVYECLYNKEILSSKLCEKALNILSRQRDSGLLKRYLWEDVKIVHKTGALDYLSHDTGIFYYGSQPYYLGIFIEEGKQVDGNRPLIGEISRKVLDYYKET